MNNDENQQTTPADYLNQIAPKTPKRMDFLKQKPIMIGGIVLAVFFALMLFAAIVGGISGGTAPIKTLAGRLKSTESTVIEATENIKNTKLRALNSNLKIYLTNTIRDYTPILTAEKIDIEKLDANTIAKESNEKMMEVLEDARLNAEYDLTYSREMTYQLNTVLSLMRQIDKSSNKKMKNFIGSAIDNLEPIQKQFAGYNATNN